MQVQKTREQHFDVCDGGCITRRMRSPILIDIWYRSDYVQNRKSCSQLCISLCVVNSFLHNIWYFVYIVIIQQTLRPYYSSPLRIVSIFCFSPHPFSAVFCLFWRNHWFSLPNKLDPYTSIFIYILFNQSCIIQVLNKIYKLPSSTTKRKHFLLRLLLL